jgi:hypothetical protein
MGEIQPKTGWTKSPNRKERKDLEISFFAFSLALAFPPGQVLRS